MISDFADIRALVGRFLLPYWPRTALLIALSILAALLASIYPVMLAPVMDVANSTAPPVADSLATINLNNAGVTISHFVLGGEGDPVRVALISVFLFALIGSAAAIAQFVTQAISASITLAAQRDLQQALHGHLLRQDMDFFNASRGGDLANRFVVDAGEVMTALDLAIRQGLQSILQVVVYGFLLVQTAPRLALATALVSLVHVAVNRLIGGRLRRSAAARMSDLGQLASHLGETFAAIRAIKSAAVEAFERSRFALVAERSRRVAFGYTITKNAETPLRAVADTLALAIVLALAVLEFAQSNLTFQGLVLFMAIVRFTIAPISLCAQAFTRLQAGLGSGRRVLDVLAREPTVADGHESVTGFHHALALRDVYFRHGQREVLSGLDLEVRRGQTVAIVGPSGAGKSTILDLILRFHDPATGMVTLDDVDIRNLQVGSYRRLFGVVPQDPVLLNDTIERNISFGRDTGSPADLEHALEIANAAGFVAELPAGLQTVVGDRGVRLSGGQRQRIAIARAIYAQPAILLLDEATSALDSESEQAVQRAVDRVLENATAIVIAHRLSTVVHADRIVVLDGGRIQAVGRHDELLGSSPLYRRLCEMQFGTALPVFPPASGDQR